MFEPKGPSYTTSDRRKYSRRGVASLSRFKTHCANITDFIPYYFHLFADDAPYPLARKASRWIYRIEPAAKYEVPRHCYFHYPQQPRSVLRGFPDAESGPAMKMIDQWGCPWQCCLGDAESCPPSVWTKRCSGWPAGFHF
jgi:hypothetical protein